MNARNPQTMRTPRAAALFLTALIVLSLASALSAQDVPHSVGTWDPDSAGNQRAVVRVLGPADAVWARVPWRRRDADPGRKDVFVVDARTGARVKNVARVEVNREFGDIVFQPTSGAGTYYVYYLRYVGNYRSPYPRLTYAPPQPTADSAWLSKHGLANLGSVSPRPSRFARARTVAFESVDAFDSPYPMEVIATRAETRALLARYPRAPYLVFPEDRSRPIRMTTDVPALWVRRGPGGPFRGAAAAGEFYAFQLGVWAARAPLSNLAVAFGPLRPAHGGVPVPATAFRCFNFGGVDWQGRDFTRAVNVDSGAMQPIWCGVQVPRDASAGAYVGQLTITAAGRAATPIRFMLTVSRDTIRNAGDDDPYRLTRLRWLDSRLGEDDSIVPPYTPVEVHGDTVDIFGRQVILGADGLPAFIRSRFAIEMTRFTDTPRELLSGPVVLVVSDSDGRVASSAADGVTFTKRAQGAAAWEARSHAGPLDLNVHAEMEFDGTIEFMVAVRARAAAHLGDIRLEIPLEAGAARYAMGLGAKGGTRPERFEWKWNVQHNQDGAWLGDVNAGLQFTLKDDRYVRPLNTNFYQSQPLVMPVSWDNGGRGGCRFGPRDPNTYLVSCYSGPRTMAAGEVQHYDFRLLLTPFHLLDTGAQWATRYYHAFKPLDSIAETGANVVNVHHATAINPYLNYPFLRAEAMRAYVADAHRRGMRVKIYYTVRELTNHSPELFALRSLGDEVIARGPGGGPSWLQEHLDGNYIFGWHVWNLRDAAVINTGISRWHNFYVEGLRWLVENVGIDGIYLDDVAFDRSVMKRIRRVLVRGRPNPLIDLHSANQFDPADGFASSANLYLEHFPFIDRLWFGEGFDYNEPPDYWLTEISGIPFGLMGEMLQDGGNPWRGMVFGMTSRLPWSGDPRPLWHFWDATGIERTEMIGWWVPSSPVTTGRADVLATVYRGPGFSIVALASWAKDTVDVTPRFDWAALGLDSATVRITAPAIEHFQDAASFAPGQAIRLPPAKGRMLVVKP